MTVSQEWLATHLCFLGLGLETTIATCVTLRRLLDFSGLTQVSVWLLSSSLLGVWSEDSALVNPFSAPPHLQGL